VGAAITGRRTMTNQRARTLRLNATPIERHLWNLLRPLRDQGYHFRRQVPIGPYFADFALHYARLVVEADGSSHTDADYDARRDAYMRRRGFTVLRLSNADIVANPAGVFDTVAAALRGIPPLAPTPIPSPRGGGVPRTRKLRSGLKELAERTGDLPPPPPSPLRGGAGGGGNTHEAKGEE
jgi:very-short-patch-repair endonuclease